MDPLVGRAWGGFSWNGQHTINLPLVGCCGRQVEAECFSEVLDKLVEALLVDRKRVQPRERPIQHLRSVVRCEDRQEMKLRSPSGSQF